MKRLLIVLSAASLIAAMAVPSAFAAEHSRVGSRVRSAAAVMQTLERQSTSGALAPASVGTRLFASGGPNIMTSVQLPQNPNDWDNTSTAPSGTVDAAGAAHDVYWFFLEKDATIHFELMPGTLGSQIALNIFGPAATDVTVDSPLLSDTYYSYPKVDEFTAPIGGFYCVDVQAVTGASTYTLNYWWWNDNDDMPGVGLSSSPSYSALDDPWNWDDVVRAKLTKGDKVTLSLTPVASTLNSPNFDADLYLFRSGTDSVVPQWIGPDTLNPYIVAHSAYDAADHPVESFTYAVPSTGTYYADVNDYSGSGLAALSWSVTPVRTGISRTPSAAKLTYKRSHGVAKFTLGATFRNQLGLPIKSTTVYLQTSSNGKKWKSTYKGKTGATGYAGWKFTAKSKGTKYFRWYRPASSNSKAAYTSTQKVTVK